MVKGVDLICNVLPERAVEADSLNVGNDRGLWGKGRAVGDRRAPSDVQAQWDFFAVRFHKDGVFLTSWVCLTVWFQLVKMQRSESGGYRPEG